MAPSLRISLLLRVGTFILVLVSLIILVTNIQEVESGTLRFFIFNALRYGFCTMVMGLLYTLLQITFTLYHMKTGVIGNVQRQFDFYGDKFISYILATGAAAMFGFSIDMQMAIGDGADDFFSEINVSASILLIGFLLSVVSSVFSSFSLPKKN